MVSNIGHKTCIMTAVISLELDHFVVHIDNDPAILTDLRAQLARHGVPFEPDWGKGTKGFKAGNIWIGRQYFEIIRILRPDGGGWVEHWVKRHHQGKRGLYCLFLKTDRLDALAIRLREAGIPASDPERITYRAFFGLFRKTMPWRMLYLPPIPGTDLEMAFIQYDPDPNDVMKAHMVPNADANGITGVHEVRLQLPLSNEASDFLIRVFPEATHANHRLIVPLIIGSMSIENNETIQADLYADRVRADAITASVTLENIILHL